MCQWLIRMVSSLMLCVTLVLFLSILLILAGDVELNPGPLRIEDIKSVDDLVKHFKLKEEFLSAELTQDYMVIIANRILTKWKTFGRAAGLSPAELEAIEHNERDEEGRRYSAIERWKKHRTVSSEATYRAFIEILLKIQKVDIVEGVCYLQKELFPGESDDGGDVDQMEDKQTLTEEVNTLPGIASVDTVGKSSKKPPILHLRRSFPNLEVSGLNESKLKEIAVALYLESSELCCKYNGLCSDLYLSLKKRPDSKEDLVACLMCLDTFEPVFKSSNQPIFRDQKVKLFEATHLHKVWFLVSHYHSYFNFYIVDHITECLGTETDKQHMSSYKASFFEYAKRRVYECPAEFGYENPDDCTISVKLDKSYDNCSLDQLEFFRKKLCDVLNLSHNGVLRLCSVQRGCYELTLQTPAFVQEVVFPLSTEQETALKELKVIWLLCGDYEFTSQQTHNTDDNGDGPGDEDDDHPDNASQPTSMSVSDRVSALLQPVKKSPGSTSDSGVGKSAFDAETKSLISEFTEDLLDLEDVLLADSEFQDRQPPLQDMTPSQLNVAAYNGDLLKVKYCIEVLRCDPLQLNNQGNTTVHVAADGGQLEISKYLLDQRGGGSYIRSLSGQSPLHLAALGGYLSLVKYFVEELENDPTLTDHRKNTPLHMACRSGSIEVVNYLIAQARQHDPIEVILSDKTKLGSTILHFAAASGNLQLVQLLISDFNLNPNTPGQLGATPLLVAAQEGKLDVVQYLSGLPSCTAHVTLSGVNQNALHIAAHRGHGDIVKLLTQRGVNPNQRDSTGRTPLHLAAHVGAIEIVQYLIDDCSCEYLCVNNRRQTPLHNAASSGHLSVLKYLIEQKNVHPILADISHTSPLDLAVQAGRNNIVDYYFNTLKLKLDHPSRFGERLLGTALKHGHLTIIKQLVSRQKWTKKRTGFRQNLILNDVVSRGHLDVLKFLVLELHWEYIRDGAPSLLWIAVENGNLNVLKFLIKARYLPDHNNIQERSLLHCACLGGYLDIIKFFAMGNMLNPVDVSEINSRGFTPLDCAIIGDNLSAVQYLIDECGADPLQTSSKGSWTPFHLAVDLGILNLVKFFIRDLHVDLNVRSATGYMTSLHIACANGHTDIAHYLLEQPDCNVLALDNKRNSSLMLGVTYGHLDIVDMLIASERFASDQQNSDGLTVLHMAARCGHLEVVKSILSMMPIDQNGLSRNGRTALSLACAQGHEDIVRYLVSCNCSMSPDRNGVTLLHHAAGSGNVSVIQFLVNEKCFGVMCRDSKGSTPLHYAVVNGQLEAAKYLVFDMHCEPNILDSEGKTPILHSATLYNTSSRGKLDIDKFRYFINVLKCNPTIPSKDGRNVLHVASYQGDLKFTKFLTFTFSELHYNILSPDCKGITPLHLACFAGHLDVVDHLTPPGLDVTAIRDHAQQSPLHYAVLGGHLKVAKLLVLNKAHDPYCTNQVSWTPFHVASSCGHLDIVKWFFSGLQLDPNTADVLGGITSFHLACKEGHEKVVQYLLDLPNCNAAGPDFFRTNGLHMAAQKGHTAIVKMLCEGNCCDIALRGCSNSTPLHLAVNNGHLDVVQVLISTFKTHDKDFNIPDDYGSMPIHSACEYGHLEIVECMVSAIDKDFTLLVDSEGQNPLHRAVMENRVDIVDYLLRQNPGSIVSKTSVGHTVLHLAVWHDHPNLVKHLVTKYSVDINARENGGLTPFHQACMHGCQRILEFFLSCPKCDKYSKTYSDCSTLDCAVIGGHLHIIKTLLGNACTYLPVLLSVKRSRHLASALDHLDIANFLDKQLEEYTAVGPSPFLNPAHFLWTEELVLHRCADKGYIGGIKYLIEEESYSPNRRDCLQRTPLHYAVMHGLKRVVTYLLNAGASVLAEDVFHNLPLHYAVAFGKLGVMQALLQRGSPCTTRGILHMTPLEMAKAAGHLEVMQDLLGAIATSKQKASYNTHLNDMDM